VQGFAKACALRAPTPFKFYGYTPSVKFERGFLGKPDAGRRRSRCSGNPSQNAEKGLPQDRRLRADGFIIRAQAMIRTDGFFVRARFCKGLRAARANPVQILRIHTIRKI
jgi:hypothetical protein